MYRYAVHGLMDDDEEFNESIGKNLLKYDPQRLSESESGPRKLLVMPWLRTVLICIIRINGDELASSYLEALGVVGSTALDRARQNTVY